VTGGPLHDLMHAYVDGELADEERRSFEAHLLDCATCRRALADEQAIAAALKGSAPLYEAPDALRQRVEGLVRRPRARRRWALVAVAVPLTVLGLALWFGHARRKRPKPGASVISSLAAFAADTHLRFARGQLPLEITSEQPDVVTHWFAGRVPFEFGLPDYPVAPGQTKPYRLTGGRLVSYHDDYAAYVAYRMDWQPISLLVLSAERVLPAGGSIVHSGPLVFHTESVSGLKVITWSDRSLTYALVSDVAVGGARSCVVCHGTNPNPETLAHVQGRPSS
jgi:anti-sigma factor RsiW